MKAVSVFLICIFTTVHASDPCYELCELDGPAVCTGGSWSKGQICHAYLFRGAPALRDHCYHSATTAAICPSNGIPVTREDAIALIAMIRARRGGHANGAAAPTTSTPAPRAPARIPESNFFQGSDEELELLIAELGVEPVTTSSTTSTTTPTTTTTSTPTTWTTTSTTTPRPTTTTTPVRRIDQGLFFEGSDADFEAMIANLGVVVTTTTTTTTSTSTTTTTTTTPTPTTTTTSTTTPLTEEFLPFNSLRNRIESMNRQQPTVYTINQIIQDIQDAITSSPDRSRWYPEGNRVPEYHWRLYGGPALLGIASVNNVVIQPLIMLATNLRVAIGEEAQFAMESGLHHFCSVNADAIRQVLRQSFQMRHVLAELPQPVFTRIYRHAFAATLPMYCPQIFDSFDLRRIALYHQLLRRQELLRNANYMALVLAVHRERALAESVDSLSFANEGAAIGLREVTLIGEPGEGSGIIREWFTVVAEQIFNPETGLFLVNTESARPYSAVTPTGMALPNAVNLYRAVGRFLALSVVMDTPIGIDLPLSLLAVIIGEPLTLDDLEDSEPEMAKSFRDILALPDLEVVDGLLEITIDGVDYPVTAANRFDLVHRKLNSQIGDDIGSQVAHIRTAFIEVIPQAVMQRIISVRDLRQIIVGEQNVDIDAFRAYAQFEGYHAGSPQIRWLFNALHSFEPRLRSGFIMFVTASPTLPAGGFAALSQPIKISRTGADITGLPTANTCVNTLYIPVYASEAVLRQKLKLAIESDSGIGFI